MVTQNSIGIKTGGVVTFDEMAGSFTGSSVTQYAIQVGGALDTIVSVSPSATSGVPLISQGSSANPAFGTAVVAGGGTGITSATAYAPICGGTTATGAWQSADSGISNSGYVLTSTGSSSLPTWQAASGGSTPYKDLYWKASDFDALETNFAALTQDNGTTVKAFVRAFDDTTTEYVNFTFNAPTDLDTSGTVTFRVFCYAATAVASRYAAITYDHRAITSNEAIDSSYSSKASGDIALSGTQDNLTIGSWTETVSNLGWAANDLIISRISRTGTTGTNLTGDLYVLGFEISIPRA